MGSCDSCTSTSDLNITIMFNNDNIDWKNHDSDRQLSSLHEYVAESFNLEMNTFRLQYDDNQGISIDFLTNDDLNDAFEFAKASNKSLKICVITNDQLNEMSLDSEELFKQNSSKCGVSGCDYSLRLLTSLKFYQSLHFTNDANKDKLIGFYHNIYPYILGDVIHLYNEHGEELDNLYDLAINNFNLTKCDIFEDICKCMSRHRGDIKEDSVENDAEFIFIRDLYDAIHCYILHEYDMGFAVHKQELQTITDSTTGSDGKADVDAVSESIEHKFKIEQTDKFNVLPTEYSKKRSVGEITFIDGLDDELYIRDRGQTAESIQTVIYK